LGLKLNLSPEATKLWDRRNAALVRGSTLMSEKPDFDSWTRAERRAWLYALAIGRRLERLQ
jgi:hypothetical protein